MDDDLAILALESGRLPRRRAIDRSPAREPAADIPEHLPGHTAGIEDTAEDLERRYSDAEPASSKPWSR